MPKRVIQGQIVKKSGDKTACVLVERKVLHPQYHKIVKRNKKYLIHDDNNHTQIGDVVTAIECTPISKHKRFKLKSIIASNELVQEGALQHEGATP